jgi:ketosteroid isomerase-like protein
MVNYRSVFFTAALLILMVGCSNVENEKQKREYVAEIINTEKAFAALADSIGIKDAFLAFADDSAVLMRNNAIIKGKQAIAEYYSTQDLDDFKLHWSPDFTEVSESGDLGYTYGKFEFAKEDSSGLVILAEGIFHTVWKRQPDGSWKFVWD